MSCADDQKNFSNRDQPLPQEVAFSVIDSEAMTGELLSGNNTGMLIDLDDNGVSLLTRIPVAPGNIVRLSHRGASRLGIVMWSVESPDNCRIQVRFI